MKRLIRIIFLACCVRPLVSLLLGRCIKGREHLPVSGPTIIAANHNSHLDILYLIALMPLKALALLRPVAAADYFCSTPITSWLSSTFLGIIPLERKRSSFHADPLAGPAAALEQGEIVIIFPEGSRGKPEELGQIKPGVAHLAKRFPAVPVVPVFMRNLGRSLPRGSFVLVPFCGKAAVAEPRCFSGDTKLFTAELAATMQQLEDQVDGASS
jgi:1-acyl-sn-glycerol-3-phosphate acyltransferase